MERISEPLANKVVQTMEIRSLVRDEERKIKEEQRQLFKEEVKNKMSEKKAVLRSGEEYKT